MPKPKLLLTVDASTQLKKVTSWKVSEEKFEGGGITIDTAGVHIDSTKEEAGGVPFDRLKVVKDIGSGCSSTVRLARDEETGKMYALKCIGLYDKTVRHQLLAEIKALFKSDCEGLVDFMGASYREGEVVVMLEFMNLGGLNNVLDLTKTIPEQVLACMAFQILWGLGYLQHEHRVHRDVKPQNILVNTDGRVKLTDFGISRELGTAVFAKTFVGTFKYMSPERMCHDAYGYAADIWSFGLVLLECATGKYPYPESSSAIGYVTIVTDGEIPKPDPSKFTPEFCDFIAECLAKAPGDRSPATALLGHRWLEAQGATDIDVCREVCRKWLNSEGVAETVSKKLAEPPKEASESKSGK